MYYFLLFFEGRVGSLLLVRMRSNLDGRRNTNLALSAPTKAQKSLSFIKTFSFRWVAISSLCLFL